jgi:Peptidase M50B-like
MEVALSKTKVDVLTLIALSAFSFMLATALHEHAGHALACALLGGHIKELGAFYVDCGYESLSAMGNRLVAFAGPLMSLVIGLLGITFFDRVLRSNSQLKYFLWLFGTVNLMTAAGYLLFSGVAGIGDLGTGQFGVFYQAKPEWLYRVGLAILGAASYYGVIRVSIQKMDTFIGGEGAERVNRAQTISLVSYLTGGVVAVLVGLLNPYGLVIVLVSSAASSMGGTSGLAWMMHLLDRRKNTGDAAFEMRRSWKWIVISVVFLLAYTIVFGPTLYFK